MREKIKTYLSFLLWKLFFTYTSSNEPVKNNTINDKAVFIDDNISDIYVDLLAQDDELIKDDQQENDRTDKVKK